MTNVFFCSTGLEANEGAIKIARKYGIDKGIAQPQIVVYDHAFHGRSLRHHECHRQPQGAQWFWRFCLTASSASAH